MRIIGIDTNSYYLALTAIENGRYVESVLLPPERAALSPSKRKASVRGGPSSRERLDAMIDALAAYIPVPTAVGHPDYVYIEEPPFVNSVKTFADLTAVVMVTRHFFKLYGTPVSLVNVSTWKRETTGNAKADKTEVQEWVQAHAGMPDGLTEDEYDAGCIAFRGAVAAGDVH